MFTGSGGGRNPANINIDVSEIADNVSGDELCTLLGAGCGVVTAAAAADIIPGNEVVLGLACAAGVASCAIWSVFKDEHGKKPMTVFQANESGGGIDVDDYILVPAGWYW